MGKYHNEENVFQYGWDKVVTAFWKRYPNPFSAHVLTEDVLERYRKGNQIVSKRLICKTSKFPKWAEKFVGKLQDVYLIEESVVDLDSKTLISYTRNINLLNVMATAEKCFYFQTDRNQAITLCHRHAWFDSRIHGFGGMIASYGLTSYKRNIIKTINGYNFVLEALFAKKNQKASTKPQERKAMVDQGAKKKMARQHKLKWQSVVTF